jgi:hypothetical protein
MKLSIGINIFRSYKRQDQCINVLHRLESKFNEINLYNITYQNDLHCPLKFKNLPVIKRKAKDIVLNSISEKPIAIDFFNALSETDCDYFLFLNSDILLTRKLINLVLKGEYETYFFSRHDCLSIESLDKIMPYRMEIAGFDAWAVKKTWWLDNKIHFKDYIYAEHLWDVAFSLEMYNRSKAYIGNKDLYICHEKHDLNWNESSPESLHNTKLWQESPYSNNWKEFIYSNLVKRQPYGMFLHPLSNEEELEKKLLKVI